MKQLSLALVLAAFLSFPLTVGAASTYIAQEYGVSYIPLNQNWRCEFSETLFAPIEQFWRWGTWESFSLKYVSSAKRGYHQLVHPTICYSCSHVSNTTYLCGHFSCGAVNADGDSSGQVELKPGVSKKDACEIVFEKLNVLNVR